MRSKVEAIRRRWKSGRETGSSLVELAVVAPTFILLLVGAAEFARLAYAAIEVSNAAYAGVAYGAQSTTTAANTSAMQTAAIQDGSDLTVLTASASSFCSCSNAPSTVVSCSTAATTCSSVHSLQYVKVTTSAVVPTMFHYPRPADQLHAARPGHHAGAIAVERAWRGELGAGTVEFALSLTLLLTMMFGIMEMSLGLYTYALLSESAREGTRYAMVRGSSCSSFGRFSSGCPVTAAQVQTYVQDLNFPGIKPSAMTVSTTWAAYPTGGSCTPSTSCNNPGNLVKVTVTYLFPLNIPFLHARTITMKSTSEMVIAD